jgi:hypothetical protein
VTTPVVLNCDKQPCVVCRLRQAVQAQASDAKISTKPLEANLVGIRRFPSVNSEFDDRMAVFFSLPTPSSGAKLDGGNVVDAKGSVILEKELLEDLARLAKASHAMADNPPASTKALPKRVRLVPCHRTEEGEKDPSDRTWVLAIFTVSTDPGLVARAELKTKLPATKKEIDELKADIERRKEIEKKVANLVKAWKDLAEELKTKPADAKPEDRKQLQERVKAAQDDIAKEKAALGKMPELASLEKALKQLESDKAAIEARDAELAAVDQKKKPAAAKKVVKAGDAAAQGLDADGKALDKGIAALERVRAAKEEALAADQAEADLVEKGTVPARFREYYRAVMEVPEGYAGEGRALMPLGAHGQFYEVGLHHGAPALTVGYFDGWRVATGKFVRDEYLRFQNFQNVLPRVRLLVRNGKKEPETTSYADRKADHLPLLEASRAGGALKAWLRDDDLGEIVELDPENDEVLVANWKVSQRVKVAAGAALGAPRRFRVIEVRSGSAEPAPPPNPTDLVLERRGSGPIDVWLEERDPSLPKDAKPTVKPVIDGDQYVLVSKVGFTNAHRAHNVDFRAGAVGEDGKPGALSAGDKQWNTVSNWSVGCQVFRFFDDFNLFLRMCQTSKRWLCATRVGPGESRSTRALRELAKQARSEAIDAGKAAAAATAAAKGAEDGAKLAASAPPKSKDTTRGANAARDGAQRADAQARAAERLAGLASPPAAKPAKGDPPKSPADHAAAARARAGDAEKANQAAVQNANAAASAEKSALGSCARIEAGGKDEPGPGGVAIANLKTYPDLAQWLGAYDVAEKKAQKAEDARKQALWAQVRRFMIEWYRVCDLGGWCPTKLDYVLLGMRDADIKDLEAAFAAKRDPADASSPERYEIWDGKKGLFA